MVYRTNYHEVGKTLKKRINKAIYYTTNPKYLNYRLKWNLAKKFHITPKYPIHLDIESTNNCNLRCKMCYRLTMKEKVGYLDFELYKKLIDESAKEGLKSLKLNLRGEPMLHPKIIDMVRYAKQKGILEVMFNTNGLLLTESKIKELIDAGLDKIIISIDGATKETYESIRIGGSYDLLLKNMDNLIRLARGKIKIRVQGVRMKDTEHEMDAFVKKWSYLVDDVAIEDVREYDEIDEKFDIIHDKYIGRYPCYMLWTRMGILWDGTILICCADWNRKLPLGNIKDKSIKELWNSKLMKNIRKLHKKRELDKIQLCKECKVKESYDWTR